MYNDSIVEDILVVDSPEIMDAVYCTVMYSYPSQKLETVIGSIAITPGSLKSESLICSIFLTRDNVARGVAIPWVYKGSSFHVKMLKVRVGGVYKEPAPAWIFVNDKWSILTTKFDMKEESQIGNLFIHGEMYGTDSIVGSIQINI
jgi:hypothetical protein